MSVFQGPPMGWYDPPRDPCDCEHCEECHKYHIEKREFFDECGMCIDDKCERCNGVGYIEDGNTDCPNCKASGRIKV